MSMQAQEAYRQTYTEGHQEIVAHLPLVKKVVNHLRARLPDFLETEELEQMGMIGLIEASRRFDPSRGIAFEAYARTRIRGAVIDGLRMQSDMPRSAMAQIRNHNNTRQQLSNELGRQPTQSEVAAELGLSEADFQRERSQVHQYQKVAMEDARQEIESIATEQINDNPEELVDGMLLRKQIAEKIRELPERDQLVLSLYYVEELNLKEIGAVIGVSESRVSQILSGNAKTLRKKLLR